VLASAEATTVALTAGADAGVDAISAADALAGAVVLASFWHAVNTAIIVATKHSVFIFILFTPKLIKYGHMRPATQNSSYLSKNKHK
jgi:hypothetical protein